MKKIIFTFDCYGTLIDWLGGTREKLMELYPDIDREKVDEVIGYWGEADWRLVSQGYRPYREILREGFIYALERAGLPYDDDIVSSLVESIKEWMPFPDTKENLAKLSQAGELGIISNTDREFIKASIRNMEVEFKHVIVAEDIKIYKPDPEVFTRAREILGINAGDIWIHISAYPSYDVIPAKKAGVYTVLLDRYGLKEEGARYADRVFDDFGELVEKILEEVV